MLNRGNGIRWEISNGFVSTMKFPNGYIFFLKIEHKHNRIQICKSLNGGRAQTMKKLWDAYPLNKRSQQMNVPLRRAFHVCTSMLLSSTAKPTRQRTATPLWLGVIGTILSLFLGFIFFQHSSTYMTHHVIVCCCKVWDNSCQSGDTTAGKTRN